MQNKSGTNIGQKLVVITGLAISAIGFGTQFNCLSEWEGIF